MRARWLEKVNEKIRSTALNWLDIQPAVQIKYNILESMDYNGTAARNRIWYRGDAAELEQLYAQYSAANKQCFWAAHPSAGLEVRKIHVGLPSIIVRTLSSMVTADMNDIVVSGGRDEDWNKISEDNSFPELLSEAITDTLYIGDGAWKISADTSLSGYPVLEFFPGDRIELNVSRGRIREIIFKTPISGGQYTLCEAYGRGYIRSSLYRGDSPVALDALAETACIQELYKFSTNVMLAVPMRIFPSAKYKCRGESVFNSKIDEFDSLDEVWSQWMDAVRRGRSKEYIPRSLLPTDPSTGEVIMHSNPFDHLFVAMEDPNTDLTNTHTGEIQLRQPEIPHESYLATYVTALDLCLQGLISPSTIGIDVKKLDNAEAQREKEKATLYTRNQIIEVLSKTIPQVVECVIAGYDILFRATNPADIKAEVTFGEYANPSFESQVETVGKAKTQGIMSTEACVDELYGDTKDSEWKALEVKRIKAEQGITSMDEPAGGAYDFV